eukprot:1471429-Pyramimonas_sp.AAC.1
MMIITGATGDGKSIPLWLDTMIMHMYRKKEFKLAMAQYDKDMVKYNQLVDQQSAAPPGPAEAARQLCPPKEPTMPKEIDELYDAGSTVGLGQMMKTTAGRA